MLNYKVSNLSYLPTRNCRSLIFIGVTISYLRNVQSWTEQGSLKPFCLLQPQSTGHGKSCLSDKMATQIMSSRYMSRGMFFFFAETAINQFIAVSLAVSAF